MHHQTFPAFDKQILPGVGRLGNEPAHVLPGSKIQRLHVAAQPFHIGRHRDDKHPAPGSRNHSDPVIGQIRKILNLTKEVSGAVIFKIIGPFIHGPFDSGDLSGQDDINIAALFPGLDQRLILIHLHYPHIVLYFLRTILKQHLHVRLFFQRQFFKYIHGLTSWFYYTE